MFNVSVRKIVVSSIVIAATSALSFGASTEAWGGKTVDWNKSATGSHAGKTVDWNKSATASHAGRTVDWNKTSPAKTVDWN